MFQYLMKLHYSQTLSIFHNKKVGVSVPYEITLLSNSNGISALFFIVSVPYEITLLSNRAKAVINLTSVSVPYEITLLSNLK